jgi:D-beta-D-heptose 7-phosphate kinase/D-beta-D-heptose 1-phosphate adenosyltransferase
MKGGNDLTGVVERLNSARVCCVGDLMLDHFIYGSVSRISPEAPVPVLRIERRDSMLGGAGNAVRNLCGLDCSVEFVSVVGDDEAAGEIESMLAGLPGCHWHLTREHGRKSTTKTRYIADGQQIMRADTESTQPVSAAAMTGILERFAAALEGCDAVLLSDYDKGLLSGEHAQAFIGAARAAGKLVVVDPKGRDFLRYRGATVIKPNLKELGEAAGMAVPTEAAQEQAVRRLLDEVNIEYMVVTCGAGGMLLAARSGGIARFPAEAREVFDVSGAGDTAAATLTAGLASGADIAAVAQAANLAAGVAVGRRGTAVVRRADILHEIHRRSVVNADDKILSVDEALDRVQAWKRAGLKTGFTNGCFDLLHPGHVALLEAARAHCDRLLVAVNSDASTRRLKGPGRPVQDEYARALVLASLRPVDAVVMFSDDTPLELIRRLRPDVLVKGRDYLPGEVVGGDLLPGWGGELLLVDLVPGQSTSRTAARLAGAVRPEES